MSRVAAHTGSGGADPEGDHTTRLRAVVASVAAMLGMGGRKGGLSGNVEVPRKKSSQVWESCREGLSTIGKTRRNLASRQLSRRQWFPHDGGLKTPERRGQKCIDDCAGQLRAGNH